MPVKLARKSTAKKPPASVPAKKIRSAANPQHTSKTEVSYAGFTIAASYNRSLRRYSTLIKTCRDIEYFDLGSTAFSIVEAKQQGINWARQGVFVCDFDSDWYFRVVCQDASFIGEAICEGKRLLTSPYDARQQADEAIHQLIDQQKPTVCGQCGNYSLERGYCIPRASADLPCNFAPNSIKASKCPFYFQATAF